MPPFALARAFKRYYGLPPHAAHLRLRLDKARSLLLAGSPSAAVAAATGFVDQAHFTHRFRRAFGITPDAYRRQRGRITSSASE